LLFDTIQFHYSIYCLNVGGLTSKAQATRIQLSMLTETDFVFIDESVNDASFINLYSVKTGLEALIRRIYYFTNNKVGLLYYNLQDNDLICYLLLYLILYLETYYCDH